MKKFTKLMSGTAPVVLSLAMVSVPAFAQDQDVQEAAADDVIIVTGSRITNPNLLNSSPVGVIGSEEIDLRQSNVAEELLRDVPGAVPSIGSNVNNGSGGAAFVNLRGLGSNRNLVLLDGNRITPAGLAGRVDLNNIPIALIERVDVLTGGASTTYGADAVAGVVNFVTKSDFEGAEINLGTGLTEEGDGHYFRGDVTLGANFADGRGNAVFSVGYQQSDAIYQGDRSYGAFSVDSYNGGPGGSGTTVPGVFSLPGFGNQQINAAGELVDVYAPFNFNPFNVYKTPFERFNMYGAASYEVADGIEVYAKGLYSKNRVTTIIAPSGTFGNALVIPYSNPYLPVAARNQFCTANGLTAAQCTAAAAATDPGDAAYNTFTSAVARRIVEAGTRDSEYTTQIFDYRAGVRGNITDTIQFDVSGSYGESENIQRQTGNGLLTRLRQAVLATNPDTCLDTSNGCVPINLFGPEGSITADQIDFLTGVSTSGSTNTSLSTVSGIISGDTGFALPSASNPIGFAVGVEYRKYTAGTQSDLATQTPGEVLGNGAASPDSSGSYNVKEAFAEIIVPLIEDSPFAQSLQLELGGRVSDYSRSGTNYTWKAGGSWQPIDAIKIRGNYQKAVRAPNISELFSPAITGLDNLAVDPCAGSIGNANLEAVCVAQLPADLTPAQIAGIIGSIPNPSAAQANVTVGGNLNLDVETAKTYTIGVVFQPSSIPNFTASIDYYNIKVTDAITTPTIGDVLGACFSNITAASATDPACTSIGRNPTTGALSGSVATTPGVPLPLSNLGRIETDGIDLSLAYRTELGPVGLALSFDGNWTNHSKFQATPSAINRDCVGYYSINCASIQPEFSFNQRTTFSFDQVDVSLLWRYMDGVQYEPLALQDDLATAIAAGPGNCPDPSGADLGGCMVEPEFRKMKAYHTFSLTTQWNASDNLALTLSVQNLFDKKPPLVGSSIGSTSYNSGNTYPSTYDAIGRRFAVAAKLRF